MEHRPSDDIPPKRVKRPRAAQACERCRLKKYKCDELYPCSQCKKSHFECVYQSNYHQRETNKTASYVRELEKKIDELTRQLRNIESTSTGLSREVNDSNVSLETAILNGNASDNASGNASTPTNEGSSDALEEEISEVNQHTNGIEFHGNTSSAAFLGHLQRSREPHQQTKESPTTSLISTLHNPGFSPQSAAAPVRYDLSQDLKFRNFYFEHAHVFIEGYFENLHFIHPLIDKEDFMARARALWLGRDPQPEPSFIALYLSLLSLGALIRVWDEVRLGGLTRFEWSRKLFGEAQAYLNGLRFSNDLETVQCLYLMAKICQNELNPHLAYMYLGLAIRTCLSAGFNRDTPTPRKDRSAWISKTWWGLYSLEIEMSFSVGRPDTLGMDEYHNRVLPSRDDSEYAIIPVMVDFARIIRRVSIDIYHSKVPLSDKMRLALQIERQLDGWLAGLPERVKPDIIDSSGRGVSLTSLRDPKWARRQRLVLEIRYHNVKMLLFRPFLAYSTRSTKQAQAPPAAPSLLEEAANKCLHSARRTIEIIYDTFRTHTFFRCWWYNTTYVMFATAILLLRVSKLGVSSETEPLLDCVDRAVEILEAMDESVVARKSVEIVKRHLREFRGGSHCQNHPPPRPISTAASASVSASPSASAAVGVGVPPSGLLPSPGSLTYTDFSLPDLSYGMGVGMGLGFPDYSFEGMASLFDELN
ncbi:hypothetical protein VTN77DRAFT_1240 [Rasamsonia byssochlamydoides]|uniref:uncharacterized protein n=1 Tax=Rasamsonia byssochlamydoides TaxID=89139 RepID=UPI003741EAD2